MKKLLFTIVLAFTANVCFAGLQPAPPHWLGENALHAMYEKIEPRLGSAISEPFELQADVAQENTTGNVFAVLPYAYELVADGLTTPDNLCKAILLHINVKGCVSNGVQQHRPTIDFFIGNKEYQHPDEAFKVHYRFTVNNHDKKYALVSLIAESGPLSTKNIAIYIEAVPLNRDSSFLRFSYSADYGTLARFALNAYLATLGRNKVGFSMTGTNEKGDPVYTKGIKGIVERNTMRYFFALRAYFDTINKPNGQRFEASLNRWFDFVEKYPRQLYEVPRDEYIKAKHREREDSDKLNKL